MKVKAQRRHLLKALFPERVVFFGADFLEKVSQTFLSVTKNPLTQVVFEYKNTPVLHYLPTYKLTVYSALT